MEFMLYMTVVLVAISGAFGAMEFHVQRGEYQYGLDAYRSGYPLDAGWPKASRRGWQDGWNCDNRSPFVR